MAFMQTIDPRWHRRHSGSRRIGERGVESPHPSSSHASVARALPFSNGIATLSHPTAGAVAEKKQPPRRADKRGVVPPLPLRRVDGAPFGRLDDLKVGRAADVPGVAPQQCRRAQAQDGGASDWSMEGLLGYGARVLALSMYSDK